MKNILVIQGGGRPKGNTAQLIDSFVKGAAESGHQVKIVSLIKNEVKVCFGCNACRYGKQCIQKDSFNELAPKIKQAQAAKKYFDSRGITKLPSVKALREDYAGLLEQKRKSYVGYKQARSDMKELQNIKANVDYLLDAGQA